MAVWVSCRPREVPGSSVGLQHRLMTCSRFQKIKVFNEDIDKLMKGEEVVKEKEIRLYNKIREEFENCVVVLTANIPKGKSP